MKRKSLFTTKTIVPILAVSLSQIARAATFDSDVLSGNWSNPLSWTADLGFPDTYAGDSAVINAGNVINYDDIGGGNGPMSTPVGLVPLVTGGFAIANSNTVLIDGGTLTQTTLTQEMRVGEGTGATDGVGILTIQTAGTLNTGASIGLAVGTKISGTVAGDGLLDIKDGFLILGAGAAAGGLGVGIESSTGALKVGDGLSAAGSAVVDLLTNNIQMGIGANPGALGGGTGAVTIEADGVINFGTGDINVGQGGGNGTLNVISGGAITGTGGDILIGEGAGSVGSLTNAGAIGTVVTSTGEVRIGGGGGTGTLTMTTGSLNTTGELNIGRGALTTGSGTVSGGTVSAGQLRVGREGANGTLNISAGTVASTDNVWIGDGAGSVGALVLSGGALNSTNYISVGQADGVGTVNQTGGSVTFSQWAVIGNGGGANTSQWDISGGSITSANGFEVGADRGGTMNISGTANVTVNAMVLGTRTNGNGLVNMTGGALTIKELVVAGAQSGGAFGTFNLTGGAMSIVTGAGQSTVGDKAGSVGTLNITGPAALLTNTSGQDFHVGRAGGTGNLNITGGGQMTHNWWINIARDGGSTGVVTIDGPGSKISQSAGRINVGENGTGTLDIKNGGQYIYTSAGDDDAAVGRTGGSRGTLNISTGGDFNALSNPAQTDPGLRRGLRLYLGQENDNSNGTVNMSGGTMSLLSFTPGNSGAGTVNHTGGTINVGQWLEIGQDRNADVLPDIPNGIPGNLATYNMVGGTLNAQQLIVGSRRNGSMTMSGGTVNVGSDGTVNNNGWGDFSVGQFGTPDGGSHGNGVLTQTGGTINSLRDLRIGNQAGTFGEYNISGTGTLNQNNGWFRVGDSGTGTLNVGAGGTVTAGSWLVIGSETGSTGTVNITDPTAVINLTGSVTPGNEQENSRLFIGRAGTGTLNQTAGTITIGGWSAIGLDNGTGTYNLSGGQINTVAERDFDFYVGRRGDGGTGFLNVSGTGHFALLTDAANTDPGARNGARLNVGEDNGSAGTVTVEAGGLLEVLSMGVGRRGKGTFNQNGGTVNVGQWLEIGTENEADSAANPGIYNMNGGVLNAQQIVVGTRRAGTMNVTGGTVNVGSDGTITVNGWGDFAVGRDGGGADHGNGTLTQTGGTINSFAKNLNIGQNLNTTGVYTLSGGTLNLNAAGGDQNITVGNNGGIGTMTVSGGTINGLAQLAVGNGNAGTGTLNLSGAGALTLSGELQVGNGLGFGIANMTGGTITANSWVAIGRDGGTGIFNLSGGTITKDAGESFDIGVFGNGATPGTGTLNQSGTGAIVSTAGADTNIARDGGVPGSVGIWNMTSATATASLSTLNIGNGGDGTLNLTAGTISSTGVFVARNGGSIGKLQGDGGIIQTPFVEIGGGTATVNFNGLTLRAAQDEGNYLRNFTTAISEVQAGGLTFDTIGFNVTLLNDFDGTGGVRKTGSGILNLEGLQGYATLTTSAGTTNLNNTLGTGTSTLNANATTNIQDSQTLGALNIGTVPFAPPEAVVGAGKASTVIPEPAALGLLIVGALGVLARRRRKLN